MKLAKFLFLVTILSISVIAQTEENTAVYVYAEYGNRNSRCIVKNEVIGPVELNKYRETGKCGSMPVAEYIDFEKFSIISFRMQGDCNMTGAATVTLDRNNKLFTIHLQNNWGGCRSGGSWSGWLQIEKIQKGFDIEFEETKVENQFQQLLILRPGAQKYVARNETDLNGCVSLDMGEQKYISSEKEYLAAIRQDAQSEACKSDLKVLDFAKYAYIGVSLNTGYCRRPPDLSIGVIEFGGSRNYAVQIIFTQPGETCRALSKFDLWIRVPQTKRKYSPVFRINPYTIN